MIKSKNKSIKQKGNSLDAILEVSNVRFEGLVVHIEAIRYCMYDTPGIRADRRRWKEIWQHSVEGVAQSSYI
jgi:hypothetical protein